VLPDGRLIGIASGLADQELRTPMPRDAKMLAASVGKTFVAAVALALAKEGKLGFGDKIEKWLGGEDWFPRLPNAGGITIRHLLTHSSGLPDHVHDPRYPEERERQRRLNPDWAPTEPQIIRYILDKAPLFEPGRGYSYTDTGYHLLGLIIEKASGSRYYDEVRRRFLVPLGLTLTIPSNRRDLPGLVPGYLGLVPRSSPASCPTRRFEAKLR